MVALLLAGVVMASNPVAACANPVACENALPGDPPSDWQVSGIGDTSLQGFATSMSVNVGQTVSFKVDNTSGSSYHIDILRLGYYGGDGARKIASGLSATSQDQPNCNTDSSTGLIDCGNWDVSASWTVPSTAVSGLYMAHLVRNNGKGSSQIPFVVRNDASHSNILLSTSDATWEAYNDYGGNSLYSCTNGHCPTPPTTPGGYTAAYAVSYNRPFDGGFVTDGGASYLFYAEYQMIRFLEQNGYDVSYTSSSDVDRAGSLLLNHNVFVSSAHDEYWSAGQRQNVTAARNAGVNLAFFSGNEIFWKTRWTSDGSGTPYRTLTTYKETHFLDAPVNPQRVDPQDPPSWTGTWQDPRGGPPDDGGQPQNALSGQLFIVNAGTTDIAVPYQYSKLRIWRNTGAASLAPGGTDSLGTNTLGYEWDIAPDNGFRPPGEIDLSSTTDNVQAFTDYGTNVANGQTETHHLTLYRSPTGALVFGAGTVQWAWGLDNTNAWQNAGPSGATDPDMQQATINLLADMCSQPATLMAGLVPASASTDTTPPTSTVTSTGGGTITGTAHDTGGGVVAGVEVSTDGGSTWHPATLTTPDGPTVNWTYSGSGSRIESRATNDSGYTEGISYASDGCGAGGGGAGGSGTCSCGGGAGGSGTCSCGSPTTAGTPHPAPTSTPTSSGPGHRGLDKGAAVIGRTATETKDGRLALWILNPNYIPARGNVKLTARPEAGSARKTRTTQIGTARFNIPGTAKVKVTILLSKRARAYLAKHKSLKTRVVIVLSSNGTSKTSSVTIVVKAPKHLGVPTAYPVGK